MPLQKQPVNISFAQGLETKVDPYQIPLGKFQTLNNSVFTTTGRLTKRDGFPKITALPNANQTTLTTLSDNLLATGSDLFAFSQDTNQWLNQGLVQPVQLTVQSLVRSTTGQTSPDAAVSALGLTCLTYIDSGLLYYQISDSNTGQQIVPRTLIVNGVASPRAFLLGRYFIITYIATIGPSTHLQYIAIPVTVPTSPFTPFDISTTLTRVGAGYDGYVANNNLYLAWEDNGFVAVDYLSSTLVLQTPVSIPASTAKLVSITADITNSTAVIYVSFWDSTGGNNGYVASFDQILTPIITKTLIIAATVINEITSVATGNLLSVFYENQNTYVAPYPVGGVKTDFISTLTVTSTGTISSTTVILRSVGLASKAFIQYVYTLGVNPMPITSFTLPTAGSFTLISATIYMLVAYGETNQPSYFLIESSGSIIMRLAYSNGGGYETNQVLPNVSLNDNTCYIPYLIKDFLATVNKLTLTPSVQQVNAIYTQVGINLAKFSINTTNQHSSEIANALHLTGGQLWMYDGVRPVEHGFQVWPENIQATTSTTGGLIEDQTNNYVFTYEWTDNQGNLHRSAPSIPFTVVTTGGNTSSNTLYVPTLRLTYKRPPNPVRIVGYRWSDLQQTYYQFTSITSPVVNSTTTDYVTIIDTHSNASILGQTLLYTTGGVIEDIAAPASIASALFKNRLFLIDAEDPNLLWFSKQVIENTPVEMSDLLTLFVAPTSGAQGSTGPMTALSAMDDKLIIFKKDAIYYVTGIGPDNTGANNDFSDPIFITSSVGCSNPNSIVLMPNGIMFQSDKGIWLLGRDLSTVYIGSPVEAFNSLTVMSALSIPGTNQVRFTLSNSVDLMYDYFQQQWGTFNNIQSISAVLYQGKHTYLTQTGNVNQETEGSFVDGAGTPVLISFITSWINVAGLQGYERFYFMYLLGTYFSPFKLNVSLAYDYNSSPTQSILVQPDNFVAPWGGEAQWGSGGPWGGPGNPFKFRLFPSNQKCEAFQITMQESYDPSLGQAAGEGLSISGLNLVVGMKKGYRTQSAKRSFG